MSRRREDYENLAVNMTSDGDSGWIDLNELVLSPFAVYFWLTSLTGTNVQITIYESPDGSDTNEKLLDTMTAVTAAGFANYQIQRYLAADVPLLRWIKFVWTGTAVSEATGNIIAVGAVE